MDGALLLLLCGLVLASKKHSAERGNLWAMVFVGFCWLNLLGSAKAHGWQLAWTTVVTGACAWTAGTCTWRYREQQKKQKQ